MNHIANAVAPLKQASINAAVEATLKMIAEVKANLEAAGWDANAAYPFPSSMKMSHSQYLAKKADFEFCRGLVETVQYRGGRGDPWMVEWSEEGVAKTIARATDDAAFQFDCYVAKLVKKVGECDSAKMGYNNGVWFDSDLTVTKGETKEVWNTKCIVNRSVHGKLFNQFPTRKRK